MMAMKEGWHWSIKFRFNSCVVYLLCECLPCLFSNFDYGYTNLFYFFMCVWSEDHYINQVYICICHFVFPSIFLRKENTFGNKMNVLWFFIRNSHLTLALKSLSNKKLLHKRKCYKSKVFKLSDESPLRNICHCQIQVTSTFSSDCRLN